MDIVIASLVASAVAVAVNLAVLYSILRVPKVEQAVVAYLEPPATDDHDWHIRGKVEGKVIQYCLGCGAERERPNG